jgi:hypothetical protein
LSKKPRSFEESKERIRRRFLHGNHITETVDGQNHSLLVRHMSYPLLATAEPMLLIRILKTERFRIQNLSSLNHQKSVISLSGGQYKRNIELKVSSINTNWLQKTIE